MQATDVNFKDLQITKYYLMWLFKLTLVLGISNVACDFM